MQTTIDDVESVQRITPIFRKLSREDRCRVAAVATVRHYRKGN